MVVMENDVLDTRGRPYLSQMIRVKAIAAEESSTVEDLNPRNACESIFRKFLATLSHDDLLLALETPTLFIEPIARLKAMHILRLLRGHEYDFNEKSRESTKDKMQRFKHALSLLQDSVESVDAFFSTSSGTTELSVLRDFEFVQKKYEATARTLREELNYEASMASLDESRLGIQQNASVKRLTQLAFVFIPLSFVTSVFGMNIDKLSGNGVKWWTVIVGAVIMYVLVAIPILIINRVQIKTWYQSIQDARRRKRMERFGLYYPGRARRSNV
jgi:hypothetical protein